MLESSGAIPVEGIFLSRIGQLSPGRPTGFSVLDDFLPWQGLPVAGLTLFEGPMAAGLVRKMILRGSFQRTVWIHSMKQRPFFLENENCLRLQVPHEPDVLHVLPEILQDPAFDCVILQLAQPLSRAKALELARLTKEARVPVVLICRQARSVFGECGDLVVEVQEDFLAIRKAENRPTPLWVPMEMLESLPDTPEEGVLDWLHAIESVPG